MSTVHIAKGCICCHYGFNGRLEYKTGVCEKHRISTHICMGCSDFEEMDQSRLNQPSKTRLGQAEKHFNGQQN